MLYGDDDDSHSSSNSAVLQQIVLALNVPNSSLGKEGKPALPKQYTPTKHLPSKWRTVQSSKSTGQHFSYLQVLSPSGHEWLKLAVVNSWRCLGGCGH